jgi:electron transfer flavoprotein-quinone oxidoreductase
LGPGPLERHIVKKSLSFLTDEAAFSVNFDSQASDRTPYNGYTVYRPRFDRWLANEAVKAGTKLYNSCTVDDLLHDGSQIVGVKIMRDGGEIKAPVVIAADGVLSFTAKKAGLRRPSFDPAQMAVGVKALIDLPKEVIDDRFGLVRDQGASNELVGCTEGVRGGGFLYTNYDSLSIGLVMHLGSLSQSGKTPYDLLNGFMEQPQMAKLLRGGKLLEYSAHLVPEGGYDMIPEVCGNGIMVAGDAAALCIVTGLNLEGINLATHSGMLAGKAAIEAHERKDFSKQSLSVYQRMLEESYVMQDLKLYRRTPHMLHNDRIYTAYPELLCSIMDEIYRIDGTRKDTMTRLLMRTVKEKIGLKNMLSDVYTGWRAL